MAMARIYWDRENYPMVERLFRQSAEFCSEHETWKLNVAHVFFMQENKFKEAIRYYDPIVKKHADAILDVTAIVLAASRCRVAPLNAALRTADVGMISAMASIGLTVALFIAGEAFSAKEKLEAQAKMGALLSVGPPLVLCAAAVANKDWRAFILGPDPKKDDDVLTPDLEGGSGGDRPPSRNQRSPSPQVDAHVGAAPPKGAGPCCNIT